nr:pentatricopeptide repeat-containing protein, mitochondrial [Quercus suber]
MEDTNAATLKPGRLLQQFPSHVDSTDITLTARTLCEILTRSSPTAIETALSSTGISPSTDLVCEVLKYCYHYPSSAVKFFRWAGQQGTKHSTPAWNLMVDLLGKNQLFDPMWDAVRSMKQEGVLSITTFVSIFGSYCNVGRFEEAVMSFNVMDRYGIEKDVIAVNSLLSAICNEDNQTARAVEFFEQVKAKIPVDGDTFAILLEGWEKEGNVAEATRTFGEMVISVGWSPQNMSAYDTFLNTLVSGSQVDEAIKFLQLMKKNNCFPDNAIRILDQMPFNGVFADSLTYNMIFKCLIKSKKVREVSNFFREMIKNEWQPTHSNCAMAISMLFQGYDPEAAIEIWNYATDNNITPLDASANALLLGLCNLGRFSDLRRYGDEVLDRRLSIYESTMEDLKKTSYKEGRAARDKFDGLSRRWKAH